MRSGTGWDRLWAWVAGGALVLLVLLAYAQVREFEFAPLDDESYVVDNPMVYGGLTLEGAAWAFGSVRASNWHPVTWLSHMLDCEWFGLDAGHHHLTSVAIHVANSLLLLVVLWRGTGRLWPSVAVAAIFALHPLRVESVAWIAERKDVLSGFFALLTLGAYGLYARRPSFWSYAPVACAFALGLMSKSMLVTLPFVMLLLDYWPLERLRSGLSRGQRPSALFVEKLPLFALAALSATVTLSAQTRAVASLDALPLGTRLANAAVVPWAYLGKTVWPVGLACFYPHPARISAEAEVALVRSAVPAALALALVTALAIRFGRRRPYLLVGWLSYLGMLAPVIGIVQVGDQAMADRYTYLPTIGVYIAAIWGIADLAAAWPPLRRALPVALAAVAALTFGTHRQVSVWRDGRTLFEHALAVTESNYLAHNNLGTVLHARGEGEEAAAHYRAALEIRPDYPEARNNLGILLESKNELDGAEREYRLALERRPEFAPALTNLGNVFVRRGDLEGAVASYERALASDPAHAEAHGNLGFALVRLGRLAQAEAHLRQALALHPELVETEATLALLLTRTGRHEEAIPHYRSVLVRRPERVELANNLAWILATRDGTAGDAQEAVRLAEQAAEATRHEQAAVLMTLAAAYARAARFEEAVRWQQRVVELSAPEQREELGRRLELYRSGRPYRDG